MAAESSNTVAGYPVGPFERFVNGFESGYSDMTDIRKKSLELQERLDFRAAADSRKGKRGTGEGDTSTTTRQPAYDTGGGDTTGSDGTRGDKGGGTQAGGQWGDFAAPIVDFFKKAGYKPAAIEAIMGNGLAEGGFASAWAPSSVAGERSFGHWQFNERGELPHYQKWASENGVTDIKDSLAQARYVDYWLTKNNPRFKDFEDAKAATDWFHVKFERPANQTLGLRYPALARAQTYMSGGTPAPSTQVAGAPAPQPAIGSGTGAPPQAQVGQRPAEPEPSPFAEVPSYSSALPPRAAAPQPNAPFMYGQPGGPAGSQLQKITGQPMQTSALGGPPSPLSPPSGLASPGPPTGGSDPYARPQAPPPPSTLTQLASLAQQYLPQIQQMAALAPRNPNNLYGGLT